MSVLSDSTYIFKSAKTLPLACYLIVYAIKRTIYEGGQQSQAGVILTTLAMLSYLRAWHTVNISFSLDYTLFTE